MKTTLILVAVALFALPATAQARWNVRVGIADQQTAMFGHAKYRSLKLKTGRYFIRWDARRDPASIAAADAYLREARRRHVRVLMHISTNDFTLKRAHLPSLSQYRRDVGYLVRRYKRYTRDWGAWNEVNHATQPTWDNPRRAAQYFKTMRRLCRGCRIVALDILDQRGAEKYIRRFYKALGRRYARRYSRIVGIHNYSDTNRVSRRGRGTRSIIRQVKRSSGRRPQFWLTETGGVVKFGRSFPCNERRQISAVNNMFRLARRNRRDIKRLYVYNWTGTDCQARFDTGLTRANGTVRPAYTAFRKNLRHFRR